MPPKKIPRPEKGQTLLQFTGNLNKSVENESSDTATEIVNRQIRDTDGDGKTDAPKRKFNSNWKKIWPWLYLKENKMFCKECLKGGKTNSYTEGCVTFRTSSMNRHESTSDHSACVQSVDLKADMQKAMKRVHEGEDQFIHKLLKSVQWLVNENLPLSKYDSLTSFLKEVNVPGLDLVCNDNRIQYQSY